MGPLLQNPSLPASIYAVPSVNSVSCWLPLGFITSANHGKIYTYPSFLKMENKVSKMGQGTEFLIKSLFYRRSIFRFLRQCFFILILIFQFFSYLMKHIILRQFCDFPIGLSRHPCIKLAYGMIGTIFTSGKSRGIHFLIGILVLFQNYLRF